MAPRWGSKILFIFCIVACLFPHVSSAWALGMGLALAWTVGNPFIDFTRKWMPNVLSFSVVGLGAGMNLWNVAQAGISGIGYTFGSILAVLGVGWVLGRWLRVDSEASALISVGTAICGGSAIAAVAPAISAKPQNTSMALATVFMLNAVALVVFPIIGHATHMTQHQFGLWSALAIHDTSSVVGASMKFGKDALEVGTTVKLARALWIVPLTLLFGWIFSKRREGQSAPVKRPWFILGFLVMAACVTWLPGVESVAKGIDAVARRGLVVAIFLVGANFSRESLKNVGLRPLLQGVVLWLLTAVLTWVVVTH